MNIEQYLRYIRDEQQNCTQNIDTVGQTFIDNVGLQPDIYIATRKQYNGQGRIIKVIKINTKMIIFNDCIHYIPITFNFPKGIFNFLIN